MSTTRNTPCRNARWTACALLTLSALTAVPASLAAQSPTPASRNRPDFLFRRPAVSLSLRAGYAVPGESPGDIFNQVPLDQRLTSTRRNFNSAAVGGEFAVRVTERLDVVTDFGYARSNLRSEVLKWVDNNDNPIEQTNRFTRKSLTFGAKEYLWDRGRSVGHLAWIPRQWSPFVGAAAGWVWYDFVQDGDFIDFQTLDVFPDRFISSGKASTIHVFGGADWSLSPNFLLTAEGRYAWARSPMEQDFQGFNKIDLSGFQATAGISLRF